MIKLTLRSLRSALGGFALLGIAAHAQTPPPAPATYTYKTVGPLAIKASVYGEPTDGRLHPVVVWIHGGALISGGRERDPDNFMNLLLGYGYVVVSIDYRLAPETKLPDLTADVVDAFRWVREQGPVLFHGDPERIAATGSSAGGYLTLVAGYRVTPRLRALVSRWGYGDLVGPAYSEPSTQPRHHLLEFSEKNAWAQVSGPPIANDKDRPGNGGAFYQYARRQGIWPMALTGWDPKKTPEKFYPYMPLKNVTSDYPPTLLIHGENDTDVPPENSAWMAAELERHGVVHRLITVPHAEHGLKQGDPRLIAETERAAAEFLHRYLEQ